MTIPVVARHEMDLRAARPFRTHISPRLMGHEAVARHCSKMLTRAGNIEDGYARHAYIRHWRARRRAAMKKVARGL